MHERVPETASLVDLADPQKLAAQRPSHRLFRAHPALGLAESSSPWLSALEPQELGMRWFALPASERRRREADYLRALLRRAARHEGARFEAGWGPAEDERHAELATRCGLGVSPDATVRGPLSPQAIETLAEEQPGMLVVDGGPELTLVTMDGTDALGVWIDPWKRDALERELEEAWWPPAQQRAEAEAAAMPVDVARRHAAVRQWRAWLLIGWKRASSFAVGAVAALSARQAWDDGWGAAALAVVGVFTVFGILDWLIVRVHARLDRED